MKLQKKDANGSKTYNIEECLEKISGINGTVDDINAKLKKISGIEAGAEVNQKAFSNVKVGSTTIAADNKTDTLSIEAGDNITLTPDTTNDKITIAAKVDMSALDGKLDKTGGTLTGNLTGKYITGTWLQTTEATDLGRAAGKIAVLDGSGWVYYRTPAEMLADLGADYIVSQGTTGVWTWRKWASGVAEMWAVFGADLLEMTTQTWGDLYTASWMGVAVNKSARQYPFAFVDQPAVTATPMTEAGNFWIASNSENDLGTRLTHAPAYQCVRASSATLRNPRISYYVVGKYK